MQKRTCVVCADESDVSEGLECSNEGQKHFLCAECLNGYVIDAVEPGNLDKLAQNQGVCCPGVAPACASAPYTDQALPRHLSDHSCALYFQGKSKLVEQRLYEDFDEIVEIRVAAAKAETTRTATANHIRNEILTLKCPAAACRQAFFDFEGCFALKCGSCGSHFCAMCLEDCGKGRAGDASAHRHVANCPLNTSGSVFGDEHLFESSQKARRQKLLKEYLATLPAAVREHAELDCAGELRDLGLL